LFQEAAQAWSLALGAGMADGVSPSMSEGVAEQCLVPVTVYYEDTDCFGIVHHSGYLRFFERGREHLLGMRDLRELYENDNMKNFVVASATCTYKRPAKHQDKLVVRTIPAIDGLKLLLYQSVWRGEELLVEGLVTMVTVEGAGMTLCPVPEKFKSQLVGLSCERLLPAKKKPLPPKKTPVEIKTSTEYTSKIRVYVEDTDFTKVVYYANYLKFLERVRLDIIGIEALSELVRDHGLSFIIHSCELKFKASAHFGDNLDIRTKFRFADTFRVEFLQDVYRGDTLLVEGKVVLLCMDRDFNMKKILDMPVEIFKALE